MPKSDLDLLALPWEVARKHLDQAGVSYTVQETFAPKTLREDPETAIVVRVLQKTPDNYEVTIAYPVINPIHPTSSS